MSKSAWNIFGWIVHGEFLVLVYCVFLFLRGPDVAPTATTADDAGTALLIDSMLALAFAVPHSLLLLPAVRDRLTRHIPGPMYGVVFCCVTCTTLLITIAFWRPVEPVVWQASGLVRDAIRGGYYFSWFGLFYSLWVNGLGYQTGWLPWRNWMAGANPPRRGFDPRSVYRWIRHPTYLSFLGLIWFAPVVTVDRAVLIALWTAYVFVGSHLKDRRMEHYLGDSYRRYASEVPGYPGMIVGPLGRRPAGEAV